MKGEYAMKKALGYIRASSEEQADRGLGLESQRQRIKAYCALKGLELVTMHEGVLTRPSNASERTRRRA
jgi:DNA invertase Pin-like site-specific DNA recombinase